MKDKVLYRNVLLEDLVKMKQATVKKYVTQKLLETYEDVYTADGFVFAKGTYPVLLVAHMDTVHEHVVRKIKRDGPVISSPQGIGGDDRCGIYLILELIKHFKCSVVFTEDEEIGLVGATAFTKSECLDMCDNVKYIVEFDRRGNKDAVFYQCDNEEFVNFVESTGYFKKSWGTCSDISRIAPALGVAAVNLSSGYKNEHTLKETINLEDVDIILEEAKKLIKLEVEKPYEYIESAYSGYGYYGGFEDCFDEEDYEDFDDYQSFLCSKEKNLAKHIFHIYVDDPFTGIQVCVEVYAINRAEAIGIVLQKYRFCSYEDIVTVFDSSQYKAIEG